MNLTTNTTTKEIQDDIVIYLAAARIAFDDAKSFDAIADLKEAIKAYFSK